MRLLSCGLVAILFSASCTVLNREAARSDDKSSIAARITGFTKRVTNTAFEVADDVLPIVGATTKEALAEVTSDGPKVIGELQDQLGHLSPRRDSHQVSH
jgi:hypothetical protein